MALHPEISYEVAAILPDAVASLIHQGRVGIGRIPTLGVGGLGIHGVQIAKQRGS